MKEVIRKGILKNYQLMNKSVDKKILETEQKILKNNKFFNIDFNGLYLYKSEQSEINMPDLNPAPGIFTPVENTPVGLRLLTKANPMQYLMKIIREIFLKGNRLGFFYNDILSLIIISEIIIGISLSCFRVNAQL